MNKSQTPAIVYYQILEQREQIRKQIIELNKSLRDLNMLNSRVGEGAVDIQKIIDEFIVKQIELDVLYRKAEREMIEACDNEKE